MAASPPPRVFADSVAARSKVPLLVGLMGPQGCGKTFSALRLAAGFAKVNGGETYLVDSEGGRGLYYADRFTFRHVPFAAPFSPLDYLAVLEHCKSRGASTVIVDSMSHEHEGQGGVLEWHADELERMGGGEKNSFRAWSAPKQARRRLLNSIVQMGMNAIFCFRAKNKLRVEKGKDPVHSGWMPIAGEEFLYEMTVNFLLPPGGDGKPQWQDLTDDQLAFFKAPPIQFRDLLREPRSMDEKLGEDMARWAAGGAAPVVPLPTVPPRAAVVGGLVAGLGTLKTELVAGGLGTEATRLEWIRKTLKKPQARIVDLTESDVADLMTVAKEGV